MDSVDIYQPNAVAVLG